GALNEIYLLDVAHDADDLAEHRARQGRQGRTTSDRIVFPPIQLRRVRGDEQHLRIAPDAVASTPPLNPHGTEVTGGDLPNLHGHRVALGRVSLERERLGGSVGEWQVVGRARAPGPGPCAEGRP